MGTSANEVVLFPSSPPPTAGELPGGAAVHPDHGHLAPVLPPNLQSSGLPGGTQHGPQVPPSHFPVILRGVSGVLAFNEGFSSLVSSAVLVFHDFLSFAQRHCSEERPGGISPMRQARRLWPLSLRGGGGVLQRCPPHIRAQTYMRNIRSDVMVTRVPLHASQPRSAGCRSNGWRPSPSTSDASPRRATCGCLVRGPPIVRNHNGAPASR